VRTTSLLQVLLRGIARSVYLLLILASQLSADHLPRWILEILLHSKAYYQSNSSIARRWRLGFGIVMREEKELGGAMDSEDSAHLA
jgi:hypothetical protein